MLALWLTLVTSSSCTLPLPVAYSGLVPASRGERWLTEPQEGCVRLGHGTWLLDATHRQQVVGDDGRERSFAVMQFDRKRREVWVELEDRSWTKRVRARLDPGGALDAVAEDVALRPLATGGVGLDGVFALADGSSVPFALFVNPGAGTTRFRLDGNVAELRGRMGLSFPAQLEALLALHPEIDTLALVDLPGGNVSLDTSRALRAIRARGLTTVVPSGSAVVSAAVLVFASGGRRIVEPGGRVGVHEHQFSWFDGFGDPPEGAEREVFDEVRRMFAEMLGRRGDAFYRFTIEAAPHDEIHWMSQDEMQHFGLTTQ